MNLVSLLKLMVAASLVASVLVGCGPGEPDMPLLDAIDQHNIEAVQQHIDAGTDINTTFIPAGIAFEGASAIHLAILKHNAQMVHLLIDDGDDVNIKARETFGGSPIEWAAFFGLPAMAQLLIQAGADVNAENYFGNTPLHAALAPEALREGS